MLRRSVFAWNDWRKQQLQVYLDLSGAHLSGADLSGAHLSEPPAGTGNLPPSSAYPPTGNLPPSKPQQQFPMPPPPQQYQPTPDQQLQIPVYGGPPTGYPPPSKSAGHQQDTYPQRAAQAKEEAITEQLQFSAFYPKVITVNKWNTMFVYSHIASAIEAVRLDVSRYKDEMGSIPGEVYSHSTRPLRRGVEITVVPTCQGVTFNPQLVTFKWIEDWQQTKFRFQAAQGLQGSAGNGEITLYAGPIIIATLKIALLFESEEQFSPNARGTNQAHITSTAYNQIFVSYSHADTPVVLACRNVYKALGMQVLIDRDTLQSGGRWNEALMKMIENADIFQLFWSKHSSCSEYVRQEWQHALQVSKGESFIRPVYWERPLVPPPAELSTFHFALIELPKIKTSDYWYILKHNFTWHFSKFFGRRT